MQTTVNGVRLWFRTAGEDRKPALALAHGFPLDGEMWDAQLAGLAKDCFVIAPDLRGHGRSDVPPGPYTMEQYADDLVALLDHLGIEKAVLAGLSMGGYVALAFWRRHSNRVSGFALLDSRANADTPEGKAGRAKAIERVREHGVGALADDMLPKLLAPPSARLMGALREMILRQPAEGMVAGLAAMRDRQDSLELLPTITVPSAVIVGEADVITPVDTAREMAQRLPDARLTIVAGAGHMSPMEAPEEVNAALLALVRRSNS